MKYLDYPALNTLSAALSSSPAPETKINVRFEAYSVKPIGKEKKMFKEMEEAYMSGQEEMEEMSFSPEMKEAGLSSCFGRLDEKESRKVHFLLVSTLNSAFPDHDFSTLRPDQFTREPNAAVVFGHLTGNLLGQGLHPMGPPTSSPLLHPLSSSPSSPAQFTFQPDHQRILTDVIDLERCEVYSWFPSPEYDPHAEVEDGELSEDEYEYDPEEELLAEEPINGMDVDMDMDMDNETEASWGQAGMELEVEPVLGGGVMESNRRRRESGKSKRKSSLAGSGVPVGRGSTSPIQQPMAPPMMPKRSADEELGRDKRRGGLLWSTNYFFYSKRQKRVLFLTCWCRKRSPFVLSPNPTDSAFPTPITASTSYTPPSHISMLAHRARFRSRPRSLARPMKKPSSHLSTPIQSGSAFKRGETDVDITALIPIRGMETPRSTPAPHTPMSARLAMSAPTGGSGYLSSPSGQNAFARMTAGGFKPRTPARTMIHAAKASEGKAIGAMPTPRPPVIRKVDGSNDAGPAGLSGGGVGEGERTRKQRSESTTSPGPLLRTGLDNPGEAGVGAVPGESKGKRLRVDGVV